VWHLFHADGVLLEVLAANAGTLRELRCLQGRRDPVWMSVPVLETLLIAAPQLRVCETDVCCNNAAEARRALHNEGVFGPLRVRDALLSDLYADADADADADASTLVLLFADLATHASLTNMSLRYAPLDGPAVFDTFVDAALSLPRLRAVTLFYCSLSPASAPALARLLSSGTLTELAISHDDPALLHAPAAAPLLGDALRANATLTALTLHGTQLWSDHAAAGALLGALTAHSSLCKLGVTGHVEGLSDEDRQWAGTLLGALVAANAPALTALDVSSSFLFNDGLRPLFEALPGNSHLQELDCAENDIISDAFAADVLLPAVRANTSLRTLITHADHEQQLDAAREAEALVKTRGGEAVPA
jgi:hypothetical protein